MNITIRRRNNKYYIDDELEVTRFKAFDVINKALALIESLSSIYTIRFKYLDEYISIELVKENLKKYIDNTDQVCIVSDLECDFFMSFKNINYYSQRLIGRAVFYPKRSLCNPTGVGKPNALGFPSTRDTNLM